MSTLYLHCALCGRKQAAGLLSRGHWGHLEVQTGPIRACPTCKERYSDWETRLLATVDGQALGVTDSPRYGAVYRSGS
jgi:hypothetical protein